MSQLGHGWDNEKRRAHVSKMPRRFSIQFDFITIAYEQVMPADVNLQFVAVIPAAGLVASSLMVSV